ncbi:MAG: hypothetical protein AAFV80_24110 [Bacteroidota bacterium]
MKTFFILLISLSACWLNTEPSLTESIDTQILVGHWKLDMSPQDSTDSNFAMMHIKKVTASSFTGDFYRKGVSIKNAQINTQTGKLYGALTSGDNSGTYNTTFLYQDGMLYGTTHAIDKAFLSVWTATKITE